MPPPQADATDAALAAFLTGLTRARVIEPIRLRHVLAALGPGDGGTAAVADHLVRVGAITRFQADKVLRGHWRGLALGPYHILYPIGRGATGVVYLARRAAEGAPYDFYALKVLQPKSTDASRALARFLREADIGRRLPAHPHLTRTVEGGEDGGVYFLATEFVEGKTVRQLVAEGGPLPPPRAARAFADAAAGVHQAHLAGVVHRDLKPANVIVTPGGRAKVLDFGFAVVRGEAAPTDPTVLGGQGYVLGTMDYIAPEQTADPVGVGPAADVYALGCSLYFALTGCPPFPGGSPQDKIRWHRTQAPPPAAQINPAIPADLSDLVRRLTAKRPEDRPASAAEVARLVGAWAEPVRAVAIAPSASQHEVEVLHDAEARWHAMQDRGEHDPADDSLVVADDPSAESPAVIVQGLGPPAGHWWLSVGAARALAGGLALALVAVGSLGWAAARLLAR